MNDSRNNNITFRKIARSKSLEPMDDSNTLSPMSCDEVLGKSLDLSTNMYSIYLEEMKIEMNKLKTSLASTQKELECVILENNDLKRQVSNMNQEIVILKQLCRSPVTSLRINSSTGSKKKARRRLTDSFQIDPINLEKHISSESPEPQLEIEVEPIKKTNPVPTLSLNPDQDVTHNSSVPLMKEDCH